MVLLAAARRSRPAGGHFHLLAQMKVTKAKCLNTLFVSLTWPEGVAVVSPSQQNEWLGVAS
jgi:hypothetical protein